MHSESHVVDQIVTAIVFQEPSIIQRIPTNLITGFLGAGKTTAILSLLSQRPSHERWAVLVNEYGMVSLDHVLLQQPESQVLKDGSEPPGTQSADPVSRLSADDLSDDSGVMIDEMAGGCFCCTLVDSLPLTLNRLVRRARPHRLLIEPTGAGHPASVVDLLRSEPLCSRIDLRATICLVDPRDLENPRITNREVFRDQIQMADVAVVNFTDKCTDHQVKNCLRFIHEQDPPKLLVRQTSHGRLQKDWLDASGIVTRPPLFQHAHSHEHPANPDVLVAADACKPARPSSVELVAESVELQCGVPLRFINSGLGQVGCGWIFHPSDVFQHDMLMDCLDDIRPILRLKGVFHTSDDWWSVQRRGHDQTLARSAYRKDSRLEVICEQAAVNWDAIQQRLLAALL